MLDNTSSAGQHWPSTAPSLRSSHPMAAKPWLRGTGIAYYVNSQRQSVIIVRSVRAKKDTQGDSTGIASCSDRSP